MRFLHVSKNDTLSKDNFIPPPIHKKGAWGQHDFNMDGAFYLSKATDDGDSMWLNYRRILQNNPSPPRRIRRKKEYYFDIDKNIDDTDHWLTGYKHYFDVDFEKHHIYVISNPCELKDFFVKYGAFKQRIKWTNESQNKLDKFRLKTYYKVHIINTFIDNLDTQFMTIMNDHNKVIRITENRNFRNMPFVKIKNNQVIIPKKGITFEFLIDLYRTKTHYDKIVGDVYELMDKVITHLDGIDFPKMVRDGYNGLYYSTNLFTQYDTIFDIPNENDSISHSWNDKFIKRPEIGEFPECMHFFSKENRDYTKTSIEQYIQWLGSDTLILWKWIF